MSCCLPHLHAGSCRPVAGPGARESRQQPDCVVWSLPHILHRPGSSRNQTCYQVGRFVFICVSKTNHGGTPDERPPWWGPSLYLYEHFLWNLSYFGAIRVFSSPLPPPPSCCAPVLLFLCPIVPLSHCAPIPNPNLYWDRSTMEQGTRWGGKGQGWGYKGTAAHFHASKSLDKDHPAFEITFVWFLAWSWKKQHQG